MNTNATPKSKGGANFASIFRTEKRPQKREPRQLGFTLVGPFFLRPENGPQTAAASWPRWMPADAPAGTHKRSGSQREMQHSTPCEVRLSCYGFCKHAAAQPQRHAAPLEFFPRARASSRTPRASHSPDTIMMLDTRCVRAPEKKGTANEGLPRLWRTARASSRARLASLLPPCGALVSGEAAEGRCVSRVAYPHMRTSSSCVEYFPRMCCRKTLPH